MYRLSVLDSKKKWVWEARVVCVKSRLANAAEVATLVRAKP